jgi:hypothetical protein
LALHHLDPAKKDFNFGAIRANPKSWQKIVEELRKCILVCHNCHSEIHEGLLAPPTNIVKFNEEYAEYTFYKGKTYTKTEYCPYKKLEMSPCKLCGQEKPIKQEYCSRLCTTKGSWRVEWESVDLLELLKQKSQSEVGRELGISEAAIRKRKRKLLYSRVEKW